MRAGYFHPGNIVHIRAVFGCIAERVTGVWKTLVTHNVCMVLFVSSLSLLNYFYCLFI